MIVIRPYVMKYSSTSWMFTSFCLFTNFVSSELLIKREISLSLSKIVRNSLHFFYITGAFSKDFTGSTYVEFVLRRQCLLRCVALRTQFFMCIEAPVVTVFRVSRGVSHL